MKKFVLALFLAMTFVLPTSLITAVAATDGSVKLNGAYTSLVGNAGNLKKYGAPIDGGSVDFVYPDPIVESANQMYSVMAYIAGSETTRPSGTGEVTWLEQANSLDDLKAITSFNLGVGTDLPKPADGKFVQVWYNDQKIGSAPFASPLYPYFRQFVAEKGTVANYYNNLPLTAQDGFYVQFRGTLDCKAEKVIVKVDDEKVGEYTVGDAVTIADPAAVEDNQGLVWRGWVSGGFTDTKPDNGNAEWFAWVALDDAKFEINKDYQLSLEFVDTNNKTVQFAANYLKNLSTSFKIQPPTYKFTNEAVDVFRYASTYDKKPLKVTENIQIDNIGNVVLNSTTTEFVTEGEFFDEANGVKFASANGIAIGAKGNIVLTLKKGLPVGIYEGTIGLNYVNGDAGPVVKVRVFICEDSYTVDWNYAGGTYAGPALPTTVDLASAVVDGVDKYVFTVSPITKRGVEFQGWFVNNEIDKRAGIESINFRDIATEIFANNGVVLFARWSDAPPIENIDPLPPAAPGAIKLVSTTAKVGNGILALQTSAGAPVQGYGTPDLVVTSSNAAVLSVSYDAGAGVWRYSALKAGTAVVQIKIGTTLVNAQVVTVSK